MLSRHAEDLYWLGRYIERAEDTARLLDVTYHTLLESSPVESSGAWWEVLEVLFLHRTFEGDTASAAAVTEFLVLDEENPGSIIAAVTAARANALGLRDRISTELWESVNAFYLELRARDLHREIVAEPYHVYRWVRNTCQTVTGVAAETMPRDDGYRFLLLGRLLERAEMTCRLLAVRYHRLDSTGVMAFSWWAALLKAVSAFEAFLKEHHASVQPQRVLEFLLLSPSFPRSVLYCLGGIQDQLNTLLEGDALIQAQRLLGIVRARVEYCDIDEVVDQGLGDFLDDLQDDIWKVGDGIDAHFFRHGAALDLRPVWST